MEIAIGLFFEIAGVLLVLLSQVWFGYKAWRKYGSLKKAFFAMVSVMRVRDERKIRERSEEELKKKFPEWWTLASFLREDLWITAIGLIVTLVGFFLELFSLTLTM